MKEMEITTNNTELTSIKQRFGIIGNSPALNYALGLAVRVASTDLTVLISGESGVGKEIFSKVIHSMSPRKHNPFIAINCGAIPEGTIDSELFGHEKGAFTGAIDSRKGYFETVSGGTIFLDEIGEMPLNTQARLLRVLETGEFIKVGSSKVQKTDVRVIAATNVDLADFVARGKFREDLYYRLNTVPIKVPSLRERKEDIYLLFRKFAVDFAEKYRTTPIRLTPDAVKMLEEYAWPGNVRELKNVTEQISVLSVSKEIDAGELKKYLHPVKSNLPAIRLPESDAGYMSEREILYKLLFEMRKDLNDVKSFVLRNTGFSDIPKSEEGKFPSGGEFGAAIPTAAVSDAQVPLVIRAEPAEESQEAQEVEESLSIAEKEKELIIKALKKHKGRRKDAARDLGISERTLYRKIKEYGIQE